MALKQNKASSFEFGANVHPELLCKHGEVPAQCSLCEQEWKLSQEDERRERLAREKQELKHSEKGTKDAPNLHFICGMVEAAVKNITKEIQQRYSMPISASSIAPPQNKTNQQPNLLHGSDVPKNMREVTLVVTGIRTSPPGFGAPLILDFEPQFNCAALALNKTNIRALGSLCEESFGTDDLEKLIGASVIFQIVNDKNPQTGKDVPTLRVAPGGIILSRRQPASKKSASKNGRR